jgi:Leucine-rich repeat (LRR) protein/energy-coupling factor transporter ATP-binding protein EcfA2
MIQNEDEDLEMEEMEMRLNEMGIFLDTNETININELNRNSLLFKYKNLHEIREIDLSNNNIKTIKRYAFHDLRNLTEINLANNQIESIDKDIFHDIQHLKKINFSNNKLTSFNESTFIGLQRLLEMDFSSNHITSINNLSFYGSKSIYEINFADNKITSIEKDIFIYLKRNLHIINFNKNLIKSIHKDAFKDLKLEIIDLSENEIESIQDIFNNLKNLIKINLSENKIESIHKDTFKGLEDLEIIDLSGNILKSIDEHAFNNFPNLAKIYLSNNKIKSIHGDAFKDLNDLREIKLSQNEIESIDEHAFNNLPNLAEIDLSNNKIKSIHQKTFLNLTNLKRIFLHSLSFMDSINSNIFTQLKNLEILTLFEEKIIRFPTLLFEDNQEITIENLNKFFCKKITFESTNLCLTFTTNKLNSIELKTDKWKCFEKPFIWENINDKLSVLIGKTGTGKTTLLNLINDSINSTNEIKNNKYFISKYYCSLNDTKKSLENIKDIDEFAIDFRRKMGKTDDFRKKNGITDFGELYDGISEFSVMQYFDFLLLNDYLTVDTEFSRFPISRVRIKERKEFLKEYFDNGLDDYCQDNFAIEYYLGYDLNIHKLSDGEYLILLIELWRVHAKKLKELNEKHSRPVNNKLRILLLDEPDAHIHPSLIKEFIDLITSNELEYLNFQVIMTTHRPATVNFVNLENIYELKLIDDTNKRVIVPVEKKSVIIQNISDDLFYIKEKFKFIYVEGEKKEDQTFYEFILNLKTNKQKLFPVKFVEMGGKKFNQLFRIDNNQDLANENKLDEFLFGINDGDYLIEEARDFFKIADIYDCMDNYQDNFKRLNRYCMENYIYDPINLSFALNHFIKDKNHLKKDNSNGLYDVFVDFIQEIKAFNNINEFIINKKDYKAIFDSYLKDINLILIEKFKNLPADHKFLTTYKLNTFQDPKLKQAFTVHFENFDLDYYPLLLFMSGKEELFKHINNEIIQKVGNLKSMQDILTYKSEYFDPIDYYFALKKKLKESDEQKEIDCVNKFLSKINPISISCDDVSEYLKEENKQILENILKNSYEYLIKMIEQKSHMVVNKLKDKKNQNESEKLIFKYCLIYNLMRSFANVKKIRDTLGLDKSKPDEIFDKLLDTVGDVKKLSVQIKDILVSELFSDLLSIFSMEKDKIKSGNVDDLKGFLETFLGEYKNINKKLKSNKISKTIENFELNEYNEIFDGIQIDLLEEIYLAELNLKLTIPKQKLIKTFETTGFLLDKHLADIMESILDT